MTSPEPTPKRTPVAADSDNAALCDALTVEHSTIYGYGIVSALCPASLNNLVIEALGQHRQRRDDVIAILSARRVPAPVPAAGYQLPIVVGNAADAARVVVRMESDCMTVWRAAIEKADTADDRAFSSLALTQSAVMAARWNRALNAWPLMTSFPGGNE